MKKLSDKKQEKKIRKDEPDMSGTQLKRWVKVLSQYKPSETDLRVLAKGLNFAIVPVKLPVTEIVTATAVACQSLPPDEADTLRSEVVGAVKNTKLPKDNLSKEERKALTNLKKNKDITIIQADKGKCVVVMNKEQYVRETSKLLEDTKTYRPLDSDPTKKLKGRLQRKLRALKKEGQLDQVSYNMIYPTSDITPRFYATPKIHKDPIKMRPIVSGINSITYNLARHLADIMKPLVGKSERHLNNSKDLVKKIQEIQLEDDEVLTSFDVSALFTSVPGDEVVQMAVERARRDCTWSDRTQLSTEEFGELLKMTVETTYFTYQGKVYEQVYGMAMGSPLSPILANLFMEEFEEKALTTAPHPPKFWARYVDDTGVVTKKLHEEELFNHINRQHPSIKFTIETEVDNSLPMLDLKLNRTNNTIIADIYRKPTHTDHYLQWSSHHPVQQKLGIVCTLMHRADIIISDNNLKKVEKEKIRTALRNCGYPEWALKEGEQRGKKRDTERFGLVCVV